MALEAVFERLIVKMENQTHQGYNFGKVFRKRYNFEHLTGYCSIYGQSMANLQRRGCLPEGARKSSRVLIREAGIKPMVYRSRSCRDPQVMLLKQKAFTEEPEENCC